MSLCDSSPPIIHYSISHLQVPPPELKWFPADVGAAVHLSEQLVVGGKVVDESAAKAETLHQSTHLSL